MLDPSRDGREPRGTGVVVLLRGRHHRPRGERVKEEPEAARVPPLPLDAPLALPPHERTDVAVTAHLVYRESRSDLVERVLVRFRALRPGLVDLVHERLGSILARSHRVRIRHEPHERHERVPPGGSKQGGAGHLLVGEDGGVLDVLEVGVGSLILHLDVLLLPFVVFDGRLLIVRLGQQLVLRVQRVVHPLHHLLRVPVRGNLLDLLAVPRLVLPGELSAPSEEHGGVAADVEVFAQVPVRDAVHGHGGDVRLGTLVPFRGVGPVLALVVERRDSLVRGAEVLAVRAPRREELQEAVLIRPRHCDAIVEVGLGQVDGRRRDRRCCGAFRRETRDEDRHERGHERDPPPHHPRGAPEYQ